MNQHRSCKLEASGNLGKTSARHCGRHEQAPWRWKRFSFRWEMILLFTGGKVPTKLESVEGSEPLMQEEEDSWSGQCTLCTPFHAEENPWLQIFTCRYLWYIYFHLCLPSVVNVQHTYHECFLVLFGIKPWVFRLVWTICDPSGYGSSLHTITDWNFLAECLPCAVWRQSWGKRRLGLLQGPWLLQHFSRLKQISEFSFLSEAFLDQSLFRVFVSGSQASKTRAKVRALDFDNSINTVVTLDSLADAEQGEKEEESEWTVVDADKKEILWFLLFRCSLMRRHMINYSTGSSLLIFPSCWSDFTVTIPS